MTCYTIMRSIDKEEFEKKVVQFLGSFNTPLKVKEGSGQWLSGDVYEVTIEGHEDTPMTFCAETGGAIWFKSFWDCDHSSDHTLSFLRQYLTGFYAWVDFFEPKRNGKFESLQDWADANGINNYGAFVPSEDDIDDLLDNFEITNIGELRSKIYEIAILGYSEAFSDEFYSDSWYTDTWKFAQQDDEGGLSFDVWIHCAGDKIFDGLLAF